MEKIDITICTGTTCYVMGGSDLLMLADRLDPETARRVAIKGCGCLGLCRHGEHGKAPFVQIDDTVLPQATTEMILKELKKRLQ